MGTILKEGEGKDNILSAQEFVEISQANGWGKDKTYELDKVEEALKNTFYIVSLRSKEGKLLGCARALPDDMFFTTIPDIFVSPAFHRQGLATQLLERIKEKLGHTVIFFGAQPGKEELYEKVGFEKGLPSYMGKFSKN